MSQRSRITYNVGAINILKELDTQSFNVSPVSTPGVPPEGQELYVDNADNTLKSINPQGIIKVYNPNTTKGDIISHTGITDVRVPVGNSGQILSANPATSSGLQWINNANGAAAGETYSIPSTPTTQPTYTFVMSFIYRGSSVSGPWQSFSFVSFKNSSSEFTYSVRLYDSTNQLQIGEVNGLSNEAPSIFTTSSLSNIPTNSAIIEFQCKLSTANEFGVICNSLQLIYS